MSNLTSGSITNNMNSTTAKAPTADVGSIRRGLTDHAEVSSMEAVGILSLQVQAVNRCRQRLTFLFSLAEKEDKSLDFFLPRSTQLETYLADPAKSMEQRDIVLAFMRLLQYLAEHEAGSAEFGFPKQVALTDLEKRLMELLISGQDLPNLRKVIWAISELLQKPDLALPVQKIYLILIEGQMLRNASNAA